MALRQIERRWGAKVAVATSRGYPLISAVLDGRRKIRSLPVFSGLPARWGSRVLERRGWQWIRKNGFPFCELEHGSDGRAARRVVLGKARWISSGPGVAGVDGLRGPEDFLPLAAGAVSESDRLRNKITSGSVSDPLQVLRSVDGMSNAICRVIDAADFLRNAHADEGFRDAADETFSRLAEYIQELNADDSIYRVLCGVVSDEKTLEAFTEEQRRVAKMHVAEYERGGIHLPGGERAQVMELQNEATRLERLYEHNIVAKRGAFQVPRDHLQGVPSYVLSQIPQPGGQPHDRYTLLTDQSIMSDVLKSARSGAVRRAMYLAGNSIAGENVQVLEELMAVRHALAKKVGFESFAHRATSEKMAGTPAEVARFLDALSVATAERADREMEMLRKAKKDAEGSREIFPWDVPYYMGLVKARE